MRQISQEVADAEGVASSDMAEILAIEERDRAQEAADALADAIGRYFNNDPGEHSNLNCPWENALETIEAAISSLSK